MANFTKTDLKNSQQDAKVVVKSSKGDETTEQQFDKLVTSIDPLHQDATQSFKSDGFLLPPAYTADGTGLPFSKVQSDRDAYQLKRNIITWFVPEFGIVKMFINPNNIEYSHRKLIESKRTKGGYSLQYWGEELSTMSIRGTTGSSGIEGINVLYEIYRAEQYAFDTNALVLAANNDYAQSLTSQATNLLQDKLVNQANSSSGTAGDLIGLGLTNTLANLGGINSAAPTQPISLAKLAFSVEMYYNGWVYRGYFTSMNITESADNFLINYVLQFTITQKRGYRTNYFPWSRSPKDGPSRDDTPHSFSGRVGNKFLNNT
jgi:hypothetical protein